ncbi:MAG: Ldh family oxidoreductase [Chloroflexi bacterium]|nr:Ldh family oxidoreductase [Chloroflexota bacterium]
MVSGEKLKALVSQVFQKLGVPKQDADTAADVLVLADLRGVDSHGVSNYVQSIYVPGLTERRMNPRPSIQVVRETPVTALVDGDSGLGLVVGVRAMELAIRKAQAAGVGFVTVRNSRHYGMAQYYSLMALPHDMVGLSMTNATPIVTPTFGREPRYGTNPLSVAVPAGQEPPFVLDMATSTVAMGKVILAERMGVPLPLGWAADAQGTPTTDAVAAREARRLLPLGGTREQGSHKGYGLALVVDILSGILSGVGGGPMVQSGSPVGHFFGALRVDAFRPVGEFKAMMDAYLREMKSTPPAPGQERVYYAGLMEYEMEQHRRRHGIPLHPQVVAYLRGLCGELGVPAAL